MVGLLNKQGGYMSMAGEGRGIEPGSGIPKQTVYTYESDQDGVPVGGDLKRQQLADLERRAPLSISLTRLTEAMLEREEVDRPWPGLPVEVGFVDDWVQGYITQASLPNRIRTGLNRLIEYGLDQQMLTNGDLGLLPGATKKERGDLMTEPLGKVADALLLPESFVRASSDEDRSSPYRYLDWGRVHEVCEGVKEHDVFWLGEVRAQMRVVPDPSQAAG
jgi:hypothetical protein